MRKLKTIFSNMPGAWQGITLALVTLPVWLPFALIGQSSRGEIVWLLTGAVALTATAHWNVQEKRWFWPVLGAFMLAHLPLIWWDPLHGQRVAGARLTPFIFVDYVFAYGVVAVVKKYIG